MISEVEKRSINYHRDAVLKRLSIHFIFTALSVLLLFLTLNSLPSSRHTYKNVSLESLNPEMVEFYTESQHISLVFNTSEGMDTIRSLRDYAQLLQKAPFIQSSIQQMSLSK